MPTDIVELCIAACCIASMALVRSAVLAPRDGLDRAQRAVATGLASTVVGIIANCIACLLNTILLSSTPLSPSTMAVTAPLVAMIVASIVAALAFIATKKIHAPLYQLLTSLAPAIVPAVLLIIVLTAMLVPSQNLFHAALSAVATGFGFTVLLRLSAAVATSLDDAGGQAALAEPQASTKNAWLSELKSLTARSPTATLLIASLIALLGSAFDVLR